VSSLPAVPTGSDGTHDGTRAVAIPSHEQLPSALATPTVLVYSDDAAIRTRVVQSVGTRPDLALGPIDWVEVVDGKACIATVDAGGIDVAVLDGEAWPTGGMGIARQLRDEIENPPATILLVQRPDDRWLATWSRADAVLPHPVDPFALTETVLRLLRERATKGAAVVPADQPRGFGLRRS
jgi:DNA-binding response OmpR family regulator